MAEIWTRAMWLVMRCGMRVHAAIAIGLFAAFANASALAQSVGASPSAPPPAARSRASGAATDMGRMIKLIRSRRPRTRIVISNPLVADVELLTDQPGSRLLNIYGKSSGTTSLTMWDETDRPLSFLVRVSLDTKDLESRIRQAFPGAEI